MKNDAWPVQDWVQLKYFHSKSFVVKGTGNECEVLLNILPVFFISTHVNLFPKLTPHDKSV